MLRVKDFTMYFAIHGEIANYCMESQKHYTYLSSSNAVDADVSRPHAET